MSDEAIRLIRTRAELARRLANATTQRDDRNLLIEIAETLDREAKALERRNRCGEADGG